MSKEKLLQEPQPRRFQLYRRDDMSGMSGTGIVAEGIRFRDGFAAYKWLTSPSTLQVAENVHDIQHIHGHNGRTNVRYLDGQDTRGEAKTLAEAYQDRNRLAIAFASLAETAGELYGYAPKFDLEDYAGGWHAPTDADDADADEWAVVWATLPTGQVSWHVPRHLVAASSLPEAPLEFDGHNREVKNNRLVKLASNHWKK